MSYKNEQFGEEFNSIPAEKFAFVQRDAIIHDQNLETKPVGFLKDAMRRFSRNKGSVVGFFVILVLVLYALIVPAVSKVGGNVSDGYYSYAMPRLSTKFDLGFWNGIVEMKDINEQSYDYYKAIPGAIVSASEPYEKLIAGRPKTFYSIKVDSYAKVGYTSMLLTKAEYEAARAYEEETGIQLLYPMIDQNKVVNRAYQDNPNAWFLTDQKGYAIFDSEGNYQSIYQEDENSEDGYSYYQTKMNGSQYQVRVLYSAWYKFKNGHDANFIFGADSYGYDIFSRLALGARLSLILSVCVAGVNLIVGIFLGAMEGYYGGRFDLIMERIKEILGQVPLIVFMTLFQLYFANSVGAVVTMFLCFIVFGWIGSSSTVRAQFYRFKGQEYVMAARTLGAKDSRLIFRHILPNAAGFIITTSVLSIPSVIFSESTLTFLGIVNLQTSTMTSVGTLLDNGQASLSTYPHCVLFPALFISLLLICFNVFGNGLRDAFNPSLRGTEE